MVRSEEIETEQPISKSIHAHSYAYTHVTAVDEKKRP